jgi:[ribosomal protein S5]-alanine N-acetyltransferase
VSVQLTSQRLVLRDLELGDWPAVHAYASRPEVYRFQPWGPSTPAEAQAFVSEAMAQAQHTPREMYQLALLTDPHEPLIGVGSLRMHSREHRQGELGYVLHSAAWGRGYATEAAQRLLEFGFVTLGLHRIFATCDPRNTASARVLEKLGMQREGQFRHAMMVRDGWRDSLMYSVLDHEWRAMHG